MEELASRARNAAGARRFRPAYSAGAT